MKVVVVGGGKVGFYLSATLLEHGHEPVLIERDHKKCQRIANLLDLQVTAGTARRSMRCNRPISPMPTHWPA